jgi:histone deacetylase 1/2
MLMTLLWRVPLVWLLIALFINLVHPFLLRTLALSTTSLALRYKLKVVVNFLCVNASMPWTSNKLSATDGTLLSIDDSTRYRSIVGGLQYRTMTRPDLSFAVNKVCQYLHVPRCTHWSAVKRILWYIKATVSHDLLLRSATTSPDLLSAFSDADWAGNSDDRRSTGGYEIFYGGNLVA